MHLFCLIYLFNVNTYFQTDDVNSLSFAPRVNN